MSAYMLTEEFGSENLALRLKHLRHELRMKKDFEMIIP
jgi:hypothetical protein